MGANLVELPFDHYQRYATTAALVREVLPDGGSVLEVGANRQRLLADFLPLHTLLFTDIERQDGERFVIADARALPFRDAAFDAVVALDVLEHMPATVRVQAIAEMSRVARRVIVACCPTDRPDVHAAEAAANAVWGRHMGGHYPWLEEHAEHGLVDPAPVLAALTAAGLHVVHFRQGSSALWSALMGAHFAKEAVPELAPLVASLDRFYNDRLFADDRPADGYRDFFCGFRDAAQARLAALHHSTSDVDAAGATLLAAVAAALHPAIDRLRKAEFEWSAAAERALTCERTLAERQQALHDLGLALQASEERAVGQLQRADEADRKCVAALAAAAAAEAALAVVRVERDSATSALADVRAERDSMNSALEAARGDCNAANAALAGAHERIAALQSDVDASRAKSAQLAGYLDASHKRVAGLERRQRLVVAAALSAAALSIAYFLLA